MLSGGPEAQKRILEADIEERRWDPKITTPKSEIPIPCFSAVVVAAVIVVVLAAAVVAVAVVVVVVTIIVHLMRMIFFSLSAS